MAVYSRDDGPTRAEEDPTLIYSSRSGNIEHEPQKERFPVRTPIQPVERAVRQYVASLPTGKLEMLTPEGVHDRIGRIGALVDVDLALDNLAYQGALEYEVPRRYHVLRPWIALLKPPR